MCHKLLVIVAFLVTFSGCGGGSKSPSPSNSNAPSKSAAKLSTAREAYQLAQLDATKWKADAKLYTISQRGVLQTIDQPEFGHTFDFADVKTGASRRWIFEFFSEKGLEVLFVNVLDGKTDSFEASKFDKKPPAIPNKWIDSNAALNSARAEIEKALHISQDKYMALSKLESGEQFPVWTIEFYESSGNKALYGVIVNALTGKIEQSEKAE
jgi:hypothetical protein